MNRLRFLTALFFCAALVVPKAALAAST